MSRITLGLASCHEAMLAAPVIGALHDVGIEVLVAWFGTATEFAQAKALGLPPTAVHNAPARAAASSEVQRAAFLAAAATADCAAVMTIGHDGSAAVLAQTARERGIPVIRLAAGERTGGAKDRDRRLADHAADAWCVAGDWQRNQLLQEGLSALRVHCVGSLLADALLRLGEAEAPSPYLWLALEHGESVEHAGRLMALLEQVATTGRELDLPVRAVATVLQPALSRHAQSAPADIQVAIDADPLAQLQAARGAALIVTDSAGYQELAAAAGIACVVTAKAGARADLLAAGDVQLAEATAGGLLAAAHRARQHRPTQPRAPSTGASKRVIEVLERLLAPESDVPGTAPQRLALPSDGDASGRTLGEIEIAMCAAALRSGTLNSTRGTFVPRFECDFAGWLGRKYVIACASGSAAVHAAIAALQLSAGDEVVTTPITDMGALTPIFYEGGVPVFADVDPDTLNVTADTIAAQLTARTRAIVVTHLFGSPCDMARIVALAEQHGLPLIEDTAQAFGATLHGRKAGTFGQLACFSLQQGKHITTGEGGIVCTDDEALARRLFLFVNKAWGYGDKQPDHYFPALNYRLTELQGAVACAQLPKLDDIVARRREVAAGLRQQLAATPGIACPGDPPAGSHAYWKFAFRVDAAVVAGGAVALGARMREAGIACVPRYVQKPAFECALFRDWRASPVSWLPLQHNPRGEQGGQLFDRRDYPGACRGLEQVVVLPINERYQPAHIELVASAIDRAARDLAHV